MSGETDSSGQVQMHPASVLVRLILILNEQMEFIMQRELDVNETDFQAMQHLIQNGSMSPGELAQLLHLTPAAATTVIDRLVKKGHVNRAAHPTDRRRSVISPSTASVRTAIGHLMPMILDVDEMARGYNSTEQDTIVNFLNGVVGAMRNRIDALETTAPTATNPRHIQR